MPDPITAITGGSAILGAVGSGKDESTPSQQKTGYEALPSYVRDYLKDNQFDRIKEYGAGEYQGIPMRQAKRSDYDPTFGSAARVDYGDQQIQRIMNNQAQAKIDALAALDEEVVEEVSPAAGMQNSFLDSLSSTITRSNPRGDNLGGGVFAADLVNQLQRGGGDISGALTDYGFTPENYRTQNLSQQAMGALIRASNTPTEEAPAMNTGRPDYSQYQNPDGSYQQGYEYLAMA